METNENLIKCRSFNLWEALDRKLCKMANNSKLHEITRVSCKKMMEKNDRRWSDKVHKAMKNEFCVIHDCEKVNKVCNECKEEEQPMESQKQTRTSFKEHLRKIMSPEAFAKWETVRASRKHKKKK